MDATAQARDPGLLAQLSAAVVPIGLTANQVYRADNTVLRHSKVLGLELERDRKARSRDEN
jgi:hypothetical protein